jgi:hypothetical protein
MEGTNAKYSPARRFEFARATVLSAQRHHAAVVSVPLCATIGGHKDLSYSPIQHRHIHVFPGVKDISTGVDPIDVIRAAQAVFRR